MHIGWFSGDFLFPPFLVKLLRKPPKATSHSGKSPREKKKN
jgi:hypothetical protein